MIHRPWSCDAESYVVLGHKNEVVTPADYLKCCKSGGVYYVFVDKSRVNFQVFLQVSSGIHIIFLSWDI